jgi:hypothetical protein
MPRAGPTPRSRSDSASRSPPSGGSRGVSAGRSRRPAGGSPRRVGTPLLALSENGTPKPVRNGSDTDALRAIEQTESRIYGKPKETVETQTCEIPEQLAEIRAMPFEQKLALLRELGPIPLTQRDD